MNAGTVHNNSPVLQIQQTQDEIHTLQQEVVNANQMIARANSACPNLSNSLSTADDAKPDQIYGKSVSIG